MTTERTRATRPRAPSAEPSAARVLGVAALAIPGVGPLAAAGAMASGASPRSGGDRRRRRRCRGRRDRSADRPWRERGRRALLRGPPATRAASSCRSTATRAGGDLEQAREILFRNGGHNGASRQADGPPLNPLTAISNRQGGGASGFPPLPSPGTRAGRLRSFDAVRAIKRRCEMRTRDDRAHFGWRFALPLARVALILYPVISQGVQGILGVSSRAIRNTTAWSHDNKVSACRGHGAGSRREISCDDRPFGAQRGAMRRGQNAMWLDKRCGFPVSECTARVPRCSTERRSSACQPIVPHEEAPQGWRGLLLFTDGPDATGGQRLLPHHARPQGIENDLSLCSGRGSRGEGAPPTRPTPSTRRGGCAHAGERRRRSRSAGRPRLRSRRGPNREWRAAGSARREDDVRTPRADEQQARSSPLRSRDCRGSSTARRPPADARAGPRTPEIGDVDQHLAGEQQQDDEALALAIIVGEPLVIGVVVREDDRGGEIEADRQQHRRPQAGEIDRDRTSATASRRPRSSRCRRG